MEMKMNRKFQMLVLGALGATALLAGYGCASSAQSQQMATQAPAGSNAPTPTIPTPGMQDASPVLHPAADAGIPVVVKPIDPGAARMKRLARNANFGSRSDAFALLPMESRYEQEQRGELILGTLGGFTTYFEPPEEQPDESEIFEPQPPRRASGIVLGESVYAIIQMETGQTIIVRPGSKIQVGDVVWTVASIDEDKVVLRREGNRQPKTIIIRLSGQLGG